MSTPPEFITEEKYWEQDGEGVRFLDPIFGEAIDPLSPPRCVREHGRFGPGLEFLASLARDKRLKAELILALHGETGDFDDIAQQYGRLLLQATVVGIESDWDFQPHTIPDPLIHDNQRRSAFQRRQVAWLNAHNKQILPCEYFAWSDWQGGRDQLTQEMKALWEIFLTTSQSEDLDERVRNQIHSLSFAAYQALRRPAIMGQFGYWLARLHDAALLPKPPEPIAAALVLGIGHNHNGNFLNALGIPTQTRITQHKRLDELPEIVNYLPVFLGMKDRATFGQLDVPFGF